MSNTHDTGGPAYPMPSGPEPRVNATTHYNEGMTLLDHFAGLVAWSLSARLTPADVIEHGDLVSRAAYHLASDMIAEKRRREGVTC